MGTVQYVAAAVLLVSFVTFVAFFGRNPLLRKTPVGWLHRVIWFHIPSGLRFIDQKLTHGRISTWVVKQVNHLWNDRHPLVLIFFMLLLGVSEIIFLPPAWPLLSNQRKLLALIVVALPWIFLYASASTDPGYISQTNHVHQMSLYPYDFTIFYPGLFCNTCRFLKPARSKHCSICKRCISKVDHHCIFINNCVGQRNHHYFILLISTTALLTTYATYVGISLLSEDIRKELPSWTIRGRGYSWTQYSGLLSYHLYLIWIGATTNETLKLSELSADMADGYVFKRSLCKGRLKNQRYEPLWTRWPTESSHIITRSFDGQHPDSKIIGSGEWERIWNLSDIPNLYDLGLVNNLRDIFLPGCSFQKVE
ncbi:putative dhhc zinc finger domain-containing protein [Erysiphe necator]|uniref:Palmitoyltransferase n=1 Tax=Uncinula necator TaxID=52586 RepID=A0A0B1P3D0_UNCNE|nr:putative dhhc zinc finger domain-containing protein [Erysiphe necator]